MFWKSQYNMNNPTNDYRDLIQKLSVHDFPMTYCFPWLGVMDWPELSRQKHLESKELKRWPAHETLKTGLATTVFLNMNSYGVHFVMRLQIRYFIHGLYGTY